MKTGKSSNFRWVVLAMAFMANFLTWGASYSVGVLFSDWIRYFNAPSSYIGFVGGLLTAVSCLAGPFFGYMIDKLGCRVCGMLGGILMTVGLALSSLAESVGFLIATFGILAGFGAGLVNFSASVALNYYFLHDRAFAEGVFGSGLCTGIFALSALLQLFSDHFSWKGGMLLLGAICFHNSLWSLFFIPAKDIDHHPLNCWRNKCVKETVESSEQKSSSKEMSSKSSSKEGFLSRSWKIWKSPIFLMILLVDFLAWIAMFVPYVHLVERARQQGYDANLASWLSSTFGIAGLVGRPITGSLCSYFNWNPFWTYAVVQMILGCATILSPFWSDIYGLFLYAILVGFLGNSYGFIKASATVMLGSDRFVDAYCWMMLFEGVGISIGPLIAGLIFDLTHSYAWSFRWSGILIVLSALICCLKTPIVKLDNHLSTGKEQSRDNCDNNMIAKTISLPGTIELQSRSE